MPELPEVQTVRQSLIDGVVGRTVIQVKVRRPGVIRGCAKPSSLLRGTRLAGIERHGKQLAIHGASMEPARGQNKTPCVCVHLGMTGTLERLPSSQGMSPGSRGVVLDRHVHVIWTLDDGRKIVFRDPRRFGGLWTFPCVTTLWHDRWRCLGQDALLISPTQLYRRLGLTRRSIKAALLDQHVIAGLGNIYVDELLFTCRLHPLVCSCDLTRSGIQTMVRHLRTLLRRAIQCGGSTLRDYADANGQTGRFQQRHRVYGRAGQPCLRCGCRLDSIRIVGRTTVYCQRCQPQPNTGSG